MANTVLNPSIIASTAVRILENELVMASRVYRGYEEEFDRKVNGYMIGDTVSIASVAGDTLVLQSSPTMIGFPNPFLDSTAVRFPIPSPSAVEMIARKPSGLTVRSLVQQNLPAGYHEVRWDSRDDSGNPIPAGPYWILYRAGSDYRCRLVVKM